MRKNVFAIVVFVSGLVFSNIIIGSEKGVLLTEFSIFCEKRAAPSVLKGVEKLKNHIRLATGKELPVVDAVVTTPMICLGETQTTRDAGITTEDLSWEGSKIISKNGNIYIVGKDLPGDKNTPEGGKSFGTLNGVLKFLEDVVGVRWLMPGKHGTYVPENSDLRITDLNIIDKPGLKWRYLTGVCRVGNNDWYANQRLNRIKGDSGTGGSIELDSDIHNWHNIFPDPDSPYARFLEDKFTTFKKHPEYFELTVDGQRVKPVGGNFSLCLSAPGINEEFARRIGLIYDNTGKTDVSLFPSDATPRCACKKCQESRIKPDKKYFVEGYESESHYSRLVIDHYYNVAKMLEKTHPDKTVTGYFYYKHEVPYKGMPVMPANFNAFIAPVRLAYSPVRHNPENNEKWHNLINDIKPSANNLFYFSYDFWYRDYSGGPNPPYLDLLHDTFSTFQKQKFKGAYFVGNLGYGKSSLLNYMLAKLLWNPRLDPEDIFVDFCDAAYGKGSKRVQKIFLMIDENLKNFIRKNIKDKPDYNMYPEMLRDVYGKDWVKIKDRYLEALSQVTAPGPRWRLEQLGANLKLLYYHLTSLNMVDPDYDSILYMSDKDYFKQIFTHRHAPWSVTPVNSNHNQKKMNAPVDVKFLNGGIAGCETIGKYMLRYHQDILIYSTRDGEVTGEINAETQGESGVTGKRWLPAIPYYSVYNDKGKLIASGIAREWKFIKFKAEKGKHYYLHILNTGRYRSGTSYSFTCNAPWALGDKVEPKGLRFNQIETPLYFYVPDGLDLFELCFNGRADAEIYDPTGSKADTIKCTQYLLKNIKSKNIKSGFWKIKFTKKSHVVIRQDKRLSGYFTVDPEKALVVLKIK
jgi:hypothetical protein